MESYYHNSVKLYHTVIYSDDKIIFKFIKAKYKFVFILLEIHILMDNQFEKKNENVVGNCEEEKKTLEDYTCSICLCLLT
jgi:hypothetical protein